MRLMTMALAFWLAPCLAGPVKAQQGAPQLSQYKDVQALAWAVSAFNALSHCYAGTAGGVGIINKRELDSWTRVVADIRDEVKKRRPGIDTQRLFIDAVRYPHMYNSVPDPALWICDDARIQLANISWVFFPHPKDNVPAQILAIMKMMRCERSGPCSEAVYKALDLAKLSVVIGRYCSTEAWCRDTWFNIGPPEGEDK